MDAPLGEWWENPTAQLEEKGKAIQSRNAYFSKPENKPQQEAIRRRFKGFSLKLSD